MSGDWALMLAQMRSARRLADHWRLVGNDAAARTADSDADVLGATLVALGRCVACGWKSSHRPGCPHRGRRSVAP